MYMVSILASFALGGVFALLVRTELIAPGPTIMARDTYNQMFTLHGTVMIFLFLIPGIPAIMGNFVLPIMLGAKDVAFPRLNLLSLYLWWIGAVFFLVTLDLRQPGHRLDLLHALQHGHAHGRRAGLAGRVHPGLQLDLHGAEFHRLDPHACGRRE